MFTERQSCLSAKCACCSCVITLTLKAFPKHSPEYDPAFKPVEFLKPVITEDTSHQVRPESVVNGVVSGIATAREKVSDGVNLENAGLFNSFLHLLGLK